MLQKTMTHKSRYTTKNPYAYTHYEHAKNNYIEQSTHVLPSKLLDQLEDLFKELEDVVHLAHSAYSAVKQLHLRKQSRICLQHKSHLHTLLLLDLKYLASHIPNFSSIQSEDLKELCDKLLTLYGQNALAVEWLLAQEKKQFKIQYHSGQYINNDCQYHFKKCFHKVISTDSTTIYFVDVEYVFKLLHQKITDFDC